jgi:hypothetical protein
MGKPEHDRTVPAKSAEYQPPTLMGLEVTRNILLDEGIAAEYYKMPPALLQQIDLLVIGGQATEIESIQQYIYNMTGEEIPFSVIRFHVTKYYDQLCTARVDFLAKQREALVEELTEVASSPALARYQKLTTKTLGMLNTTLERKFAQEENSLGEIAQIVDLIEKTQRSDPMFKKRMAIDASRMRSKENRDLLTDKAKVDEAMRKLRNYQQEREKLEEEVDEFEDMTQRIIDGETV